ncbi:hypothetical protein HPY42_05300 [Coprothermobacteraceae bacterium]|nr:hypothetical protein [Coprothermobacteraceae bacterium]
MNTQEIMQLALKMSGFDEVPGDSAIYRAGDGIRRVLFGIDIGVEELVWAKEQGYDLVIAHHPPNAALAYGQVFRRHVDFMVSWGIPKDEAEAAVADKLVDLQISSKTENFTRILGMARLLDMPFMNIHAPIDEITRKTIQSAVDKVLPAPMHRVVDVINALDPFPYSPVKAEQIMGDPDLVVDRAPVLIGAFTNGGYDVAKVWYSHGIPALIYMHVNPADFRKIKSEFSDKALVLTGHMPGDYVGALIFLRELKKRGLQITCVGFEDLV